jgi:hypothetical protein
MDYASLGGNRRRSNLMGFSEMMQMARYMPSPAEIVRGHTEDGSASTGVQRQETVSPTAAITQGPLTNTVSEVPLRDIVKYYKSTLTFRLAIFTYVGRSVGFGFYNTAETTKPAGKKALEIVNQFCEDWNLDEKNQIAARDGWMSGNFFWNRVAKQGRLIDGLYSLPLSSFVEIHRDDDGNPSQYIQQWGFISKSSPPENILHFRWMPIDEEPFGEGIGQALARTGIGYTTSNGKIVYRKSFFEIEEMLDDTVPEMVRAGLPRYFASFPGEDKAFVDHATARLNNLDPLQHFVVNSEGKVETVSLDTQNRQDSFIRYVGDKIITGTMSPLIRLWSSLDFTYASSKTAIEALDPSIDMYQRAHKRFIEKLIYRPLMLQNRIEPKEAEVRLNWGKEAKPTADELIKIWAILSHPQIIDKYNLNDLLDMVNDAGFHITPIMRDEVVVAQVAAEKVQDKIGEKPGEQKKTVKDVGYNSIEELLGIRRR